jgi:glucosamine kinase
VVGDMEIAREAVLGNHPGVVVIAGTGSIAYGRNATGETARAGGWGFQISDEGSGQWIGRTAVAEIMRAHDAERTTALLEGVLREWKLDGRDDLVRRANGNPPPNFAELFPVVQSVADEQDRVAGEVLARAGAELSRLALIVLRRLWIDRDTVKVGLAGGVFANSRQVRRSFEDALRSEWPEISVSFEIREPVLGALEIARRVTATMGSR